MKKHKKSQPTPTDRTAEPIPKRHLPKDLQDNNIPPLPRVFRNASGAVIRIP